MFYRDVKCDDKVLHHLQNNAASGGTKWVPCNLDFVYPKNDLNKWKNISMMVHQHIQCKRTILVFSCIHNETNVHINHFVFFLTVTVDIDARKPFINMIFEGSYRNRTVKLIRSWASIVTIDKTQGHK